MDAWNPPKKHLTVAGYFYKYPFYWTYNMLYIQYTNIYSITIKNKGEIEMATDEKDFISVYRTLTGENKRRLLRFFSDLLSKRPPLDKTADL